MVSKASEPQIRMDMAMAEYENRHCNSTDERQRTINRGLSVNSVFHPFFDVFFVAFLPLRFHKNFINQSYFCREFTVVLSQTFGSRFGWRR